MATGGQRAARTAPGPLLRVIHAWRVLGREQRIAALAALSLWVTMFLPWYSEAPAGAVKKGETVVSSSLTAWGAFSWVEAAVLLVSVGVLALLFARGERRAFHLPGGDGPVITLAGGWVALLVIYRLFDKNSEKVAGLVITPGNDWGIFLALFAAIWLAYTGVGIRRAHRAEPRLADDPTVHLTPERPTRAPRRPVAVAPSREERPPAGEPAREHRGVTREDAEQLSFELPRENGEN
ncbi:MAG: hypothetical protein ABR947_09840 [Solirubrobacteraceae bacterium]